MKNNFKLTSKIILGICLSFSSLLTNAQWTDINSLNVENYKDLSFPSELTGYSIIDSWFINGIYKSEDGGNSWAQLNIDISPATAPEFQSINFITDSVGFVLLRAQNAQSQLTSYIFKTTDSGNSWNNVTPATLPVGNGYADLYFVSTTEGYTTTGDYVFKTEDGGNVWSSNFLNSIYPVEIDFNDENNGIIGAWDGTFAYKGILLTTSNAGQDWDTLFLPNNYSSIVAVDFASSNTAFAMNDAQWGNQYIYKTSNNGSTWDSITLTFLADSSDRAMDLFFSDENNGYLSTSNGYIYITEDGGNTWQIDYFDGDYLDVIETNGASIFVGGGDSTLLKYTLSVVDGLLENNTSQLKVYPNPCSRHSNLQFTEPLYGRTTILNIQGQVIFEDILSNNYILSLSKIGIEKGIYFIQNENFNQSPIKFIVN